MFRLVPISSLASSFLKKPQQEGRLWAHRDCETMMLLLSLQVEQATRARDTPYHRSALFVFRPGKWAA